MTKGKIKCVHGAAQIAAQPTQLKEGRCSARQLLGLGGDTIIVVRQHTSVGTTVFVCSFSSFSFLFRVGWGQTANALVVTPIFDGTTVLSCSQSYAHTRGSRNGQRSVASEVINL